MLGRMCSTEMRAAPCRRCAPRGCSRASRAAAPAAGDAGEDGDVEDADGEDRVGGRRPVARGDQDGDHEAGEGEDQVVAAHDDLVEPGSPGWRRRQGPAARRGRCRSPPRSAPRRWRSARRSSASRACRGRAGRCRACRWRWAVAGAPRSRPVTAVRRPDEAEKRHGEEARPRWRRRSAGLWAGVSSPAQPRVDEGVGDMSTRKVTRITAKTSSMVTIPPPRGRAG
jgi:hypothetical protein